MKRCNPVKAEMRSTHERAAALARVAARFPFLNSNAGPVTERDLLALVAQELGDAEALDRFVPSPVPPMPPTGSTLSQSLNHLSRATPLSPLLHIVSGNTPHAALQSLLRGLLLGAHNRCKLPSSVELPEVAQFLALLPPWLASQVEIATNLPETWLSEAEAVVVFGSDETIALFHGRIRPDQRFIAHGHKISLGVLLGDDGFSSAPAFARDIALYNQLGCLSPQLLYIASDEEGYSLKYAAHLADALEAEEAENPRGPIPLEAQGTIAALREEYRFRAALDPRVRLWESHGSTAWSVIHDPEPGFRPSPLYRTILIKPLKPLPGGMPVAETLRRELAAVRRHLSTIALHPFTQQAAGELALATGAPRLCPFGAMQFPSPFWHHDGEAVLQPLVRWQDLERSE